MLHYDASVTDTGALSWLLDSRCKLGYNFLVWDDGQVFEIIPRDMRAPHAGFTRTSDTEKFPYPKDQGNSAFVAVAIAAGGRRNDTATRAQVQSVALLSNEIFEELKWSKSETWRFTTHKAEAWPRGRKTDSPGPNIDRPVMTKEQVVQEFRRITRV